MACCGMSVAGTTIYPRYGRGQGLSRIAAESCMFICIYIYTCFLICSGLELKMNLGTSGVNTNLKCSMSSLKVWCKPATVVMFDRFSFNVPYVIDLFHDCCWFLRNRNGSDAADEGTICDFCSQEVANLTRIVGLPLFEMLIGGETASVMDSMDVSHVSQTQKHSVYLDHIDNW